MSLVTTYFEQLTKAAAKAELNLKAVYLACGVPDSSFYRHRNGSHDPRLDLANQVMGEICRQFEDRHGVAFQL
jgi:hypothetical protein